jgi:paraquat-inducible protein B
LQGRILGGGCIKKNEKSLFSDFEKKEKKKRNETIKQKKKKRKRKKNFLSIHHYIELQWGYEIGHKTQLHVISGKKNKKEISSKLDHDYCDISSTTLKKFKKRKGKKKKKKKKNFFNICFNICFISSIQFNTVHSF